jgi:hypothetical protein
MAISGGGDSPIRITWDDSVLKRKLSDAEKKALPYAMAGALSKTAREIKDTIQRTMPEVFDRPTPFTVNSLYVSPATKDKLSADVFIKDFAAKGTPAVKYLFAEVYGGARRAKRSERALSAAGLLPGGMLTVASKYAKLDQYGNIPASVYTRILSQLKASSDPYQNQTAASKKRRRKKGPEYFALRQERGKLRPGIYERTAEGGVRPVLLFVPSASYTKRLPFTDIAQRVYGQVFPDNFAKQWAVVRERFGL